MRHLFCEYRLFSFLRISEKEFLRATLHYRRLANLLKIDYLEKNRQDIARKVRALEANEKTQEVSSAISGLVLTVKEVN